MKKTLVDKLWRANEVMFTKDDLDMPELTTIGIVISILGFFSLFIFLAVMIGGF